MPLNNLSLHLNRHLLKFLFFNLIGAFSFFVISLKFTDEYYFSMFEVFGWMFWLGLTTFFMQFFVSREKAFEWFQLKYAWISMILFLIHVVLLIALGHIAVLVVASNK